MGVAGAFSTNAEGGRGRKRESDKMTFYFPWVLWFQTLMKKMSLTPVALVLYNPNTGSHPNVGCLNWLPIMPHVSSCCDGFPCQRCILWLTVTSVMQASRFLLRNDTRNNSPCKAPLSLFWSSAKVYCKAKKPHRVCFPVDPARDF